MDADYRCILFESEFTHHSYEQGMKAFCERKNHSDFAKEMSRSVKESETEP